MIFVKFSMFGYNLQYIKAKNKKNPKSRNFDNSDSDKSYRLISVWSSSYGPNVYLSKNKSILW